MYVNISNIKKDGKSRPNNFMLEREKTAEMKCELRPVGGLYK